MYNNPFAGPAHHVALANALERERRPEAYTQPPVTGGAQISVRLSETLLVHLDMIGRKSGWTRVQVLTAMIERGLFDLYQILSDEVGHEIIDSMMSQLVPVMQNDSELSREVSRLVREVVGDTCTISPSYRTDAFWIEGARILAGIPRLLVVVDRDAADDYRNARPADRAVMIDNIRPWLAKRWQQALDQPSSEPRCDISYDILTPRHPR